MTASDQLERILYILPAAAREDGVSLEQLAGMLGVDATTVLNDVEQVTARAYYQPAATVDPFTILIEKDRIQVDALREFTRPTRLNAREALALSLGLRALALEYSEPQRSDLIALAGRLEREMTVPEIDLRPRLAQPEDDAETVPPAIDVELGADDVRGALSIGLEERRVCNITYFKSGDAALTERRIAPHKLVYASGRWYVIAQDVERAAARLFRLDRILRVQPTEEHFELADMHEVSERIAAGQEAFVGEDGDDEVVVRYSPRIARWIAEHESAELEDDGSVRVQHQVSDPRWLVRHVLQYAGEAVVETEPYRALVGQAARRLARS